MKTTLLRYILPLLFSCILLGQQAFAQTAPAFTYYTPKSYTRNIAIPALAPISTGGTVQPATYGAVSTLAATGATNGPGNMVTDAAGNLYVCDINNYRIRKVTPAGVVSTFAGTGATGTAINGTGTGARFSRVDGIAIDAAGTNLYVADYDNGLIRKIVISTQLVSTFATGFSGPAGICFDDTGNLYVADQAANNIKMVTSAAVVTTISGSTGGGTGTTNSTGTNSRYNSPSDIIYDGSGDLVIVDQGNNRIRMYNISTTAATTLAGSTAGYTNNTGTAAQFSSPNGIGMDGSGNFYIADTGNNDIRMVTPAGVVTLFAGSSTQTAGTTNNNLTTSTFSQPACVYFDANTSIMHVSDYSTGNIRKLTLSGYTISGTLATGLNFTASTGTFSGTPTATRVITTYTVTGYNYYGSYTTTLQITVENTSLMDISDANTAANGITQGILHPGQTDVVLFGYEFNVNSAMTISGFQLNATYGTNGAGFYFTNGRLYKNTTTNTFAGSTLVSGATVNFAYSSPTPAVTITGLSESFSPVSAAPVYYFLVADIGYNYNTLNATSQSMQFKFATTQTSAVTNSSSTNYAPNINVNGTNFTIAPPTLTVSNNNFTANGVTGGSLSFGQSGIVLFSFKMVIDGMFTISQFDIPSNINVNGYFGNGKVYRSSTQYFSDATQVTGTVGFNSTNTAVTGMSEALNSTDAYSGVYYYFLVGDLNNTNAGTGTLNFQLATTTVAFTSGSPFKTYVPSANITGLSHTVRATYKWVGVTNDFSLQTNYLTLTNNPVGAAPSGTTNIYMTTGAVNAPTMSANLTVAAITYDGATTPTLTLNGKTLTVTDNLVSTTNSPITITGTGTVALTAAAANSEIGSGSTFNLTNASLTNAGTLKMKSTSVLNLLTNATVTNTGTFTLASDASGTASIGQVTGTSSLTGTYIVQRFFTGGNASNRGYRLMSSPVNNSTTVPVTSAATYNFNSLKTNLFITGTGGSGSGWDQPAGYTANGPTILFYNGSGSPVLTSPSTLAAAGGTAGQGFYFYFRGNNSINTSNKVIRSAGVFATPESNVVGLQSGSLNQKSFTYNLSNAGTGYNLVGNPYPSSITVTTAALTNTNNTIYAYDPSGNSITPNSAPYTLVSGQGFFLKAIAAGASIAFTESLKTTTSGTSLLGIPLTTQEGRVRLKMVKDTANFDITELHFLDSYDKNYNQVEDADDLNGNGQVVFFGAMTADKHEVAVASQPIDKQRTSVYLSLDANSGGTFSINKMSLAGIPDAYDVLLVDHFKSDSLDLRANAKYSFEIDKANAATFGNSRMELVIRKKILPPYQLLTFSGKKASANNVLNWTVSNEFTYTTFSLERSFDGKNFEGVVNMQSTGSGSYNFSDQSNKTVVYYRLKQSDINDKISYSSIVVLVPTGESSSIFTVYPNPTGSMLQFTLNQPIKTTATLNIYNTVGRLVKSSTYQSNTGQQDVSGLIPGNYFINLIDNTTFSVIASSKFIKL